MYNTGAERIRMGFGVTVRDFWISPRIDFEDEYGPGYRYECSLIVWHPQIGWMPGLAVCSTRHKLWKRNRPESEGGTYYLPPSAIPETEVKHTVISWAIRDGIGRLFGLRNPKEEDLKGVGKEREGAMGEVQHDKKEQPGRSSQASGRSQPAGSKREPGRDQRREGPGKGGGDVGPGGELDLR